MTSENDTTTKAAEHIFIINCASERIEEKKVLYFYFSNFRSAGAFCCTLKLAHCLPAVRVIQSPSRIHCDLTGRRRREREMEKSPRCECKMSLKPVPGKWPAHRCSVQRNEIRIIVKNSRRQRTKPKPVLNDFLIPSRLFIRSFDSCNVLFFILSFVMMPVHARLRVALSIKTFLVQNHADSRWRKLATPSVFLFACSPANSSSVCLSSCIISASTFTFKEGHESCDGFGSSTHKIRSSTSATAATPNFPWWLFARA